MAIDTLSDLFEAYRRNFLPEEAAGIDAVIQLVLTGDGGGNFALRVHEQSLEISEMLAEEPDVTLTTDAAHWIDISLGHSNPMTSVMTGKLRVKGSIPLATSIQRLFRAG